MSGAVLCSLEFRAGRRIRLIGRAPCDTSGRSSRRAPVRPLRMLLAYVPTDSDVHNGSFCTAGCS